MLREGRIITGEILDTARVGGAIEAYGTEAVVPSKDILTQV